jgi:glycosyltransferase involved in cell wall biosynthesis
MRGEIESMVRRHGLEKQVRITGAASAQQVRDEILKARALVLPSFAEGLPMVIMEAMALRRPVITTYVAGIPELVRPREHGWLIPAGSVEALVEAMEDALSRPVEELRAMGAAAHARVAERHSVDKLAAELAALFAEAGR